MAISRARKEELLDVYRQQLTESSGFMMASYTALTVGQMQELRRRVRDLNGEVFVVKNTLFAMAIEEMGQKVPESQMTGPTLIAFAPEDVPSLARLFREYAQNIEENRFVVKGGMLEGSLFGAREAAAVADLPSREEMLATLLRTINAPATQTVGVVAGGIRQVLNVIKAYADKLEEAGGESAEAAEAEA